jgi:hypothetical protein
MHPRMRPAPAAKMEPVYNLPMRTNIGKENRWFTRTAPANVLDTSGGL